MPELDEVSKRREFYNRPEVVKFLSKHGVPKTKKAMIELLSSGGSKPDPEMVGNLSQVIFSVHPQQINVRDMANGQIIVSVRR